ncbi:hypothetical protein [Spirulina subsalsa]|uniref:hypothetical protein n=1 Tax=Spirulina subsalsa TaxID=54311 RepID=UPI000315900A|nr:hypothetical protein [Spirulina subsalsa]
MTELLERAIAQLKTLPDQQQNAIATRILAELENEQQWQSQLTPALPELSLDHFIGSLKDSPSFQGDPVVLQHQMRHE